MVMSLKKSIFLKIYFFLGNIFQGLFSWSLILLISNNYSPVTLGKYSLSWAMVTPVFMLSNMQLKSYLLSESKLKFKYSSYITLVQILNLLAFLFIFLMGIFFLRDILFYLLLIALIKMSEANFDLLNGIYIKENMLEDSTNIQIIKSLLGLLILISGIVLFKYSLPISLLFLGLSMFFYSVIVLKRLFSKEILSVSQFSRSQSLISFKILDSVKLLGFTVMIGSLVTYLPRYLLKYLNDDYESLAYFTVFGSIVNVFSLLVAPYQVLLRAELSKNIDSVFQTTQIIRRSQFFYLLYSLAVILIIVFFGKIIISLLYGDHYVNSKILLVSMFVALGLNFFSSIYNVALQARGIFKWQFNLTIYQIFFSLGMYYLGIMFFHLNGIGYASIIINAITLIFYYRKHKIIKHVH